MERGERIGLGVATVGHILLFGILSLGLVTRAKLQPLKNEPIDVVLVDAIGARSAAPQATPEPPAPSEAPTVAKPAEAVAPTPAPPEPAPAPEPAPVPKPAPSKPAPPKPAPPKPAPTKPTPAKPEPAKPTPAKPVPKPAPRPEPKPVPKPAAKPKPAPTPAKPAPAKPAPAKPAPAKSSPEKATPAKPATTTGSPSKPSKADVAATGDTRNRRRPDRTEGGGAPSTKPARPAGGTPGDKPAKAAGSRLGADFLKGITPEKTSPGKSTKPAAATVSAAAMQGLAGAIKRQVEPCYELGSLAGTPAMSIVTTLRLRFNKDGTIAGAPTATEHSGVNAGNQAYVRQIDDVARRAVLRCAPLKLPADLYDGGWEDIELRFTPGTMG